MRRRARRERDGRISARLIAIANALEGMDRASAARLAGMDRQTLCDWVHRYNAEGVAGLCNRPAPGLSAKNRCWPSRKVRIWLCRNSNSLSIPLGRCEGPLVPAPARYPRQAASLARGRSGRLVKSVSEP
ncbi:MAG TPA: helix-turn-helix domain-containing protein [Bryobacteraceae bacterium]|nr:helix-turn-helix domain-containing protein [Bryobacteraceae bacterium]